MIGPMNSPSRAQPNLPLAVRRVVVGRRGRGLSAAVNMGRCARSVLLVDERDRFRWQHMIHNYWFPDDCRPLRSAGSAGARAARFGAELAARPRHDGDAP